MKSLNSYITEKFQVSKANVGIYAYTPKDKEELRNIIEERLAKDKNADFNDIDVSAITDMNNLFKGLDPHNIDISDWNVANVTDMKLMFYKCENFNSNLSKWNVSNFTRVVNMFTHCHSLKNKPAWYK